MHRAGTVMRTLKLPCEGVSPEALAREAWPQAVGKRIAGHARLVGYADGRLTIEVADPVWLEHLRTMSGHIVARLQQIAGRDAVSWLEFRPGVPRREPRRSETPRAADDADGIADPVLRRLYKASRSRPA
jgi:predicted nucleic acid-binding Zn ribbon protein